VAPIYLCCPLLILPAGETLLNPTTLLNSSSMRDVVNTARQKSEVLFIDYANLRAIKNVRILSAIVDGIALVVSEGKTRRPVIKALITPLEQSKID
jgi:Mrp family chromosome partitioning ATPase